MKKTFFLAAMCSMMLVMTSCEQMFQGAAENMVKSMLVGKINDLRDYPNDIQACDSIMKDNFFEADKLVDMGTTIWKRDNCGFVSRSKSESINGASYTLSYEADATFNNYNPVYVRMWFMDAYKAVGEPKEFIGYYDENPFKTYDELSQLLSEAPATYISVSSFPGGTRLYLLLEVTRDGKYHINCKLSDVISKK